MPDRACPSARDLGRFLGGDLDHAGIATIEAHLSTCDHCVGVLGSLPAASGLAGVARAAAARNLPAPDTRVREVMSRVRRLAPSEGTPAPPPDYTPPPDAPPDAALGDVLARLRPPRETGELGRLGPYRVLDVLGVGGMGVVFRAEDTALGRLVALKVMNPSAAGSPSGRARFLREARAAGNLQHDHIVPVYGVGEDNDVPFIAMPLLRGETLSDRVKRDGKLPWPEALTLARQVAEGLAAAHAAGLVHRDIKPANVWLEPHAGEAAGWSKVRAKVLDFGLARELEAGPDGGTRTGAMLGTPGYMAPEQMRGEADARADLFALGCLLYHLLAGRGPFAGGGLHAVLYHNGEVKCVPLAEANPKVPGPVAALVGRLMAKEPGDRPASAAEAAAALRRLEKGAKRVESRPASAEARTADSRGEVASVPPSEATNLVPVAASPVRQRPWLKSLTGTTLLAALAVVGAVIIIVRTSDGKQTKVDVPPDSVVTVGADGSVKVDLPPVAAGGKAAGPAYVPKRPPDPIPPTGVVKKLPTITNSIGMELILTPAGTFKMGSPTNEPGGGGGDEREHEVELTRSFYLGATEVTQEQYERVTGGNPSKWKADPKFGPGPYPVDFVNWWDAVKFCEKLSALPAEKQAGRVYRLPTEAEWEYACRAGSTTPFGIGNGVSLSGKQANFGSLAPYGGAEVVPARLRTVPVRYFKLTNDWGFSDTHGNVMEWCYDLYADHISRSLPRVDPVQLVPQEAAEYRVLRGGSSDASGDMCRSAYRRRTLATDRDSNYGFRVAVTAPPPIAGRNPLPAVVQP